MKIQIDHYTPVPTVSVIGCEQSFGCERLEIAFNGEWKRLKKYVTFYFSEDESDSITIEYKHLPIVIPQRAYNNAGLCRYVIKGESKKKRIVSKTGYLRILKAPDELLLHDEAPLTKKRGAQS